MQSLVWHKLEIAGLVAIAAGLPEQGVYRPIGTGRGSRQLSARALNRRFGGVFGTSEAIRG